ncbi:nonribosomal peptide synthetase protein VioO [Nocardiopsis mwathae]|uniref:Nonribosomal peptide synthetase protein VioO n=1 Tax=Nocardiopsis mwathae TaxID=1472723 RepID=A0A7W9YMW5_9ACTN|nr:amino acid adenylation domain-containing protein [Nocardiopsis mwathae]MBB6175122.1 nonribosomal peptide synthetase protein VioO [Nocardiopsis mwathae]
MRTSTGGPEHDAGTPFTHIIDAFFATARRYADGTAVIDNGRPTTYRELADMVSLVAHRVQELPSDPELPVGLYECFSTASIAAALGIMAAGRYYCPIDPAMVGERLSAFVDGAGFAEVLVVTAHEAPLPEPVHRVRLDLSSVPSHEPPEVPHSPDRTAYLLFTSGSTGTPKGALLTHRVLAVTVPALTELYDIGPADRVLHFTPLFWDTSLEELLPTLSQGGCVVMDAAADIDLHGIVTDYGITTLNLPTAFWNEFVVYLLEEDTALPPCLRTVVIGGEPVRADMLERWRRLDGADRIRLLNTYGATETGMVTHAIDLRDLLALPEPAGHVPIGHPLPHVDARILDERGEPVTAAGVEGELLVGGDGIALRYHRQPEMTAERFTDLDLGAGPTRYFRTRDMVRADASGALEFVGRKDHVVKIRGVRLDLGEVEFWIGRHPGVRAVLVVDRPKGRHNALAAYVLPGPGADTAALPTGIRAYLRANVPPYLVPSTITVVPEFVYTRSRKIDREATRSRYENEAP